MSGGLEEEMNLSKITHDKDDLWTILYQAYTKNSIMGCNLVSDSKVIELRCANGLVKGHAYGITKSGNLQILEDPSLVHTMPE